MRYGNKLTNYIYYNSPPLLRNFYASVYDARKAKTRFGSHFKDYFSFLQESQYWSDEKIKAAEWEKTKSLLIFAYRNSPYYKSLFDSVGLAISTIRDQDSIERIPLLTKDIIRQRASEVQTGNSSRSDLIWEHTSGTTGTALRFASPPEVTQEYYATRELQYRWAGLGDSRKEKLAYFAGHPVASTANTKPPFWVYNSSTKDLYFSSYHISDETIPSYVRQLIRFEAVAVSGYPSSIYLIAEGILKNGRKLRARAVITSSETLLDFQRAKIEEAFGCKVYDFYGNTENCGKILTCDQGRHHLLWHGGLPEIRDGELIYTHNSNTAFPFIRYRVGDRITASSEQTCGCRRNGMMIESIEGRIEDYIITGEGRKIGRLDHIFKDMLNVREAQIVQSVPGKIKIRLVKEAGYTPADETKILKETAKRLGQSTGISFQYVERIERSKSGKFKFIVTGEEN